MAGHAFVDLSAVAVEEGEESNRLDEAVGCNSEAVQERINEQPMRNSLKSKLPLKNNSSQIILQFIVFIGFSFCTLN